MVDILGGAPAPKRGHTCERATILVVDDNRDVREGLCDLLTMEGFMVRGVMDAAEALADMQRNGHPDVLLLDLRMPNMDGWEFLHQRATDAALREVPVIILSATLGKRDLAYPVAGVFRKPANLELLLHTIRREVMKRPS